MGTRAYEPTKSKYRRKGKSAELLDTERVFCAEYVANGMKGSPAARVAFPNAKNPGVLANNVLNRPRVRNYLGLLLHKRIEESGLSAERILRQLEIALFLDPLDVFEPGDVDGTCVVKNLEDIPEDVRRCIDEIKTKTVYTVDGDKEVHFELRFISKIKSLELAMKYAGLLKDAGININMNKLAPIDFDRLCSSDDANTIDAVESKITAEESQGLLTLEDKESLEGSGLNPSDTDSETDSSSEPE